MAGKGAGVKIKIASDFDPRGFAAAERRAAGLERLARKNASTIGGSFIRAGDALQSVGFKMQKFGASMTRSVTLPLIGIGAAGVAAFKTVEDAEVDLIRRTGATGKEAEALRQTFRSVAGNTAADMSTIPPVMAQVTSRLGLTGDKAALVTRKMMALAKVSGDDATAATEELTKAMKDWSVGVDQAPLFMDKLAVASQKSGVSVSVLANNLYTFGSPLRQLGFGMDQTIALLANFERSGVRTDLVMGSLRIGLGKLAAAGEKDIPAAMARSIKAIKDAKNPSDATRMAFELFGRRAGADMAAAIREGRFSVDDLMASLKTADGALDRTGGAADSLGKQWGLARNKMILASATIGDVLAPYMMKLAEWVQKGADAFAKLDPGMKKMIVGVGVAAAAAGPLIAIMGSLISGLGALSSLVGGGGTLAGLWTAMSTGLSSAAGATGAAAGATGGLSGALGALGAAIGPVLGVIAAVAAVGVLLYRNWDQIKVQLARLSSAFAPAFAQIKDAVMGTLIFIKPAFDKLSADVVPTIKAITDYIIIAWRFISPVVMPIVTGLISGIGFVVKGLLDVVRAVMALIRGDWTGAWTAIRAGVLSIALGLRAALNGILNGLGVMISAVWAKISAWTSAAWAKISRAVVAPIIWLYNHNTYFKRFVDLIAQAWTFIHNNTIRLWNLVTSAVSGKIKEVVGKAKEVYNGFSKPILDLVAKAKAWGSNLLQEFIDGIQSKIRALGDALKSAADKIAGFLGFHSPTKEGPGKDADTWAPNLVRMYASGITGSLPVLKQAVASMASVLDPFGPAAGGPLALATPGPGSGRSTSLTIAPGAIQINLPAGTPDATARAAGQGVLDALARELRLR